MMRKTLVSTVAIAAAAVAVPGHAQDSSLSGLDLNSLRSEIQQRYDAALALSTDPAIVSGDNSRYVWANEAKVQCGIALGYLKSSTRDEVSIGKCEMAARLMNRVPAPYTPPPPPVVAAPPPEICSQRLPGIVFFEFDSAAPPADANQTIEFVSRNAAACNWTAFDVIGHTDRSGSNAYNMGLSERRAEAVASLMASMGIARSAISTSAQGEEQPRVPTEDGVRNPQNRRVEIGVR
ncbi:Outer membrane protein precursor [Tsuneonella dongtanensis]|uniref:Outer membrane protein n=1 Tax=Tsuneonella dongtanensis TaxID=692370 RepID=A0A1B2AFR0_9SPHN|nr:OmpA family protein [Tsuneonella dongtanensis]ANY20966.1 Outer membrane protein precursor [Tsuneonella dongtanensis]